MPFSLRTLSSPIQKPRGGPGVWEKNRDAPLAFGLGTCVVIDGGAFGAFYDYGVNNVGARKPGTGGGTSIFNAGGPRGGFNFGWVSGSNGITLNIAFGSGNAWTASAMVNFPGSAGSADFKAVATSGLTGAITALSSGNGDVFQTSNHNWTTKPSSYSGWHRVTVSESGASGGTLILYIDGVQVETFTGAYNALTSWQFCGLSTAAGYLQDDVFIWSRVLSPQEVAAHNADPYGSVLRLRWSPMARLSSFGGRAPVNTPLTLAGSTAPIAALAKMDTPVTYQSSSSPAALLTRVDNTSKQGSGSGSGLLTRQPGKPPKASSAPTTSFSRTPIGKAAQAATSPVGSRLMQDGIIRTDTTSPAASDTRRTTLTTRQATSSPAASLMSAASPLLQGVASAIGSRVLSIGKVAQALTSPVGAIQNAIALIRKAVTAPLTSFDTELFIHLSPQATTSPLGTLTRSVATAKQGSSSPITSKTLGVGSIRKISSSALGSLLRSADLVRLGSSSPLASSTAIRVVIVLLSNSASAVASLVNSVNPIRIGNASGQASAGPFGIVHNEQGLSVPIPIVTKQATRTILRNQAPAASAIALFLRIISAATSPLATTVKSTTRTLTGSSSPIASGSRTPGKTLQGLSTTQNAINLSIAAIRRAIASIIATESATKTALKQALANAVAFESRALSKIVNNLINVVAVLSQSISTSQPAAASAVGSRKLILTTARQNVTSPIASVSLGAGLARLANGAANATTLTVAAILKVFNSVTAPIATTAKSRVLLARASAGTAVSGRMQVNHIELQSTFPEGSSSNAFVRLLNAASSAVATLLNLVGVNELGSSAEVAATQKGIALASRQAATQPEKSFSAAPVTLLSGQTAPVATQSHVMGQTEQINVTVSASLSRTPLGVVRQAVATVVAALARTTTPTLPGGIAAANATLANTPSRLMRALTSPTASRAISAGPILQGAASAAASLARLPLKLVLAAAAAITSASRSIAPTPARGTAAVQASLTRQGSPVSQASGAGQGSMQIQPGKQAQASATTATSRLMAISFAGFRMAIQTAPIAALLRSVGLSPAARGEGWATQTHSVAASRPAQSLAVPGLTISTSPAPKQATAATLTNFATQRGHLSQAVANALATLGIVRQPIQRATTGAIVIYRPDLDAPFRFASMAAGDTDFRWLDLSEEYAAQSETISNVTVTVAAIGTETSPVVDQLAVETFTATVSPVPGAQYRSTGPRIRMRIATVLANNGLDYTVVIGWQDSDGEQLYANVGLSCGGV